MQVPLIAADNILSSNIAKIGNKFEIKCNGSTNIVNVTEVQWHEKDGIERRFYAIVSEVNDQILRSPHTNNFCAYRNELYAIGPGVQAFWVWKSQPIDGKLTQEQLAEYVINITATQIKTKEIDLRTILKPEKDLHVANPRMLRSVSLALENGELVARFVSFSGINGKVVIDEKLNVLSMKVTK